jgi:hypothetical protein
VFTRGGNCDWSLIRAFPNPFVSKLGQYPERRQSGDCIERKETKKLTSALVSLLASLTISQAKIGDTMKEVLSHGFHRWKPTQFHDCPALQWDSPARGTQTLIFSAKTNRQIASILDSRHGFTLNNVVKPWSSYGDWKLVQDDPKMASWHLKNPLLGDLWMVVTANAHVLIIATPEGLETLGLHATKSPIRNSN